MSKLKEKRPRCANCGRVLTWTDFQRGLAESRAEGGMEWCEHTVEDCRGIPLRVMRREADMARKSNENDL